MESERFVPHVNFNDLKDMTTAKVAEYLLGTKVLEARGETDGERDEKKDLSKVTKGDILERIVEMVAREHYAATDVRVVGAHSTVSDGPGDGGRDVVVTKAKEQIFYIIDCKAYRTGENVTAKHVRSIMGALMTTEGNMKGKGVVITTSSFTPEARKARDKFNKLWDDKMHYSVQLWGEGKDDDRSLKDVIEGLIGHSSARDWLCAVLEHLETHQLLRWIQ